ncbi:MAG: radical SAM protein [Desulfobulbaceae bacterium]|nr:radical SAM protein [Desulfobulbaceae bacterium]
MIKLNQRAVDVRKTEEMSRHPCFSGCASKQYGRVHLPVAAGCNIRCNYCDRRYSCVNESRPGITDKFMKQDDVISYLRKLFAHEPRISVVGIAGPGDPLHQPAVTLPILREVRQNYPHILLCLSTNGLNLPGLVDDLVAAGVGYVTVTVNAVNPEIGERIYSRVSDGNIIYIGKEAASLLLARQLKGIRELKSKGVTVKVNTVVIPGVNDRHIIEVAKKMARLDVDLMNCIGIIPVKGTPFGHKKEPTTQEMWHIRKLTGQFLPQMSHCTRCRADAAGMLGQNNHPNLCRKREKD